MNTQTAFCKRITNLNLLNCFLS